MKKVIFGALALIALVCAFVIDPGAGYAVAFTIPAIAVPFVKNNEFQEKSVDELKAMSGEDLAGYFNALNAFKLAKLESDLAGKSDKTELDSLKAKYNEGMAETLLAQMKAINVALEAQGMEIKKLKAGEEVPNGVFTSARKAINANAAAIKAFAKGETRDFVRFEINQKASANMTLAGNVSGGTVPQPERIAGLNGIATRMPMLLDLFAQGSTSRNVIEWVYQANRDGAAGGTREGDAKNQIDFDLVVASQSVVKQTALIKATDEMLEDVEWMETAINNELRDLLLVAVENSAYSGNGSAPALNGIYTVATTFSAGGSAGLIDNANEIDVLGAAIVQIKEANQTMPTAILMNPRDVYNFRSTKQSSTDKRYVERLLTIGTTLVMDGVPIIESTVVTAGQFVVGDFSKATLYTKSPMTIEIGYDSDDFSKNFKTIRAEWRGALVVKHNDRTAFVKGVFATAKAELETT
jgi:hypothetical protein